MILLLLALVALALLVALGVTVWVRRRHARPPTIKPYVERESALW